MNNIKRLHQVNEDTKKNTWKQEYNEKTQTVADTHSWTSAGRP